MKGYVLTYHFKRVTDSTSFSSGTFDLHIIHGPQTACLNFKTSYFVFLSGGEGNCVQQLLTSISQDLQAAIGYLRLIKVFNHK